MNNRQVAFSSLVVLLVVISISIYFYFNQPTKLEVSKNLIKNIDIVTETLETMNSYQNSEDFKEKLKTDLKLLKKVLIQADNIGYPSEDELLSLSKELEDLEYKTKKLASLIDDFLKTDIYNDKEFKILIDFKNDIF